MTRNRSLPTLAFCLSAAVIAAALSAPAAAQLNQPLHRDGWLLAAVHAPGQQDSIWRTDLWIVAPTSLTGDSVTLYFCQSDQDNTGAAGIQVPIVAGQKVYYFQDVVDYFLDLQGSSWLGTIHYTATDDVQVWARVYSISPDGSKSYGQLIEGVPTVDMSPDDEPWDSHDHQWMYAVKHTASGRFRVNVGIVNPTGVASTYFVAIYSDAKIRVADLRQDVPPYSMVQLSDPFAAVNGGEWSNYTLRVSCETEGGGTFAYASVVDNATNDAFFVRGVKQRNPTTPGLNRTEHADGWVLAAAHSPGEQGSIWRTDLWIRASYPYNRKATLYFCTAEQDGTGVAGHEITFTGGKDAVYIEDVVEHFLDVGEGSWLGAIHYVADTDVQVWARVYSISPDGAKSYGQLIEGIPSADMSPDNDPWDFNDHQYIVATKHTADGRFRVNVGFVNPTAVDATYALNVFDASFQEITTLAFTLRPYSMKQLTDPLAAVAGGEWNNLVLRVQCSKEGGGAFAYASVVDNATNDAYFVRGIKLLTPGGA